MDTLMMMQNTMTNQNNFAGLAQMFSQIAPQIKHFASDLANLSSACTTPVKDNDDLAERMALIDALFNCADTEDDMSAIFAHMVTDRVYEYEQKNLVMPEVTAAEALAFFMAENGVKQRDLSHIATQSIISEILNGKRKMTVEHIKGFAAHFAVPEKTFLG